MAKPKQGMVTTLKCDRMWGKRTCDWFCARFPQMKGRDLTFRSNRAVELAPEMALWLMENRFI